MYYSTKSYQAQFSTAFRQPQAESHCRFLHGYALSFIFSFEATHLDANNWVVDFGSLKPLKERLALTFDHKTVIARNDPEVEWFKEAHSRDILDLVLMDRVGCEAFAEVAAGFADNHLRLYHLRDRVRVAVVECREHDGNSATYLPHASAEEPKLSAYNRMKTWFRSGKTA